MAARFPRFHVGVTPFKGRACACPRRFNPRTRVGCDVPCEFRPACCQCFNPRTRVGCDDIRRPHRPDTALVSIHAPAWGATPSIYGVLHVRKCFNPRTRVGCDSATMSEMRDKVMFQSTHPRGVRRRPRSSSRHWSMFQSTHPRGVRPSPFISDSRGSGVSIHAPAWGATHRQGRRAARAQVSIHAPAWGATQSVLLTMQDLDEFQSTHPRGVRPQPDRAVSGGCSCFNPRTRVGCDSRPLLFSAGPISFNPRTRVGCDHPAGKDARLKVVSIHAPAWGATGDERLVHIGQAVSIHAPAWGATETYRMFLVDTIGFNPRTRVGCDAQLPLFVLLWKSFNPRTRVGCDCFHVLSSRFP